MSLALSEIWKDIPGYEGAYQVSDHGNVRSLDRRVRTVSKTGTETTRLVPGRVLAPQKHSGGYQQVGLSGDLWLVHALVLRAFIGARPDGMEVAHCDGERTNNHLTNLKYKTSLANADDRRKHGTSGAGEKNASARLTAEQVKHIRAAAGRVSQRDMAEALGVQQQSISKIVCRKRWEHI